MAALRSAITRTSVVVIVVVILIIAAAAGVYASTNRGQLTTSLSSSSTTFSTGTSSNPTTESSFITSSTTTTSTQLFNQNLTVELQTTPAGGVGIYPRPTNTWPENLIYDPLFDYNLTGSSAVPQPWLATGYTVDSTGQYWTFTLRQGVTFSDGTQFNATSLKDDIENYILAGQLAEQWATFMRGASAYFASNHDPANQTIFKQSDGLTVTSQYTLAVNLSKPEADFLSYLTGPLAVAFAVSPSAVMAHGGITYGVGNTWLISHSAGEGPYVLKSYSTATGTMVFAKNANWWATKTIGMKQPFYQITINIVGNFATEELHVRSGIANIIPLPATNIYDFANKTTWLTQNRLVSDVPGTNVFGPYLSTQFALWMMNYNIYTPAGTLASQQPLKNKHIVAAIDEAWNETAFIQQDLNGLGIANGGVMLQSQLGHESFPSPYQYNLTQSKLDLQAGCAQLGCSPSNPIQISLIASNDVTGELAGSLLTSAINSMQAGIILNFQPLATPAKISLVVSRQFGINLYEQPNTQPDPLPLLNIFGLPTGSQGSRVGFNNATITSMINQAAATSNITARSQLYSQIDKAIAQSGNWKQVAQFESVYVTSSHIRIASFNPVLLNSLPPIFAMSYS